MLAAVVMEDDRVGLVAAGPALGDQAIPELGVLAAAGGPGAEALVEVARRARTRTAADRHVRSGADLPHRHAAGAGRRAGSRGRSAPARSPEAEPTVHVSNATCASVSSSAGRTSPVTAMTSGVGERARAAARASAGGRRRRRRRRRAARPSASRCGGVARGAQPGPRLGDVAEARGSAATSGAGRQPYTGRCRRRGPRPAPASASATERRQRSSASGRSRVQMASVTGRRLSRERTPPPRRARSSGSTSASTASRAGTGPGSRLAPRRGVARAQRGGARPRAPRDAPRAPPARAR